MARGFEVDRSGFDDPRRREDEERTLPIAREAARLRIRETSLRQVAREIGMSPSGLTGALEGATPYGKTREKLLAWYAGVRGMGDVPLPVAENVLAALLRRLPEPHRGAVELLAFVAELHERADVEVPEWIGEVRHRLAHS